MSDLVQRLRKLQPADSGYADIGREAAAEIKRLERVISDGTSGRWVPVSERLPGEAVRVLTVDISDGDDSDIGYCEEDRWYWEPDLPMSTPPTHWMPLPEAPK